MLRFFLRDDELDIDRERSGSTRCPHEPALLQERDHLGGESGKCRDAAAEAGHDEESPLERQDPIPNPNVGGRPTRLQTRLRELISTCTCPLPGRWDRMRARLR